MTEITVTFEPEESSKKYSQEEIDAYIERGREKYGSKLTGITLKEVDDPDEVEIYYDMDKVPSFQRLRRITGKPTK